MTGLVQEPTVVNHFGPSTSIELCMQSKLESGRPLERASARLRRPLDNDGARQTHRINVPRLLRVEINFNEDSLTIHGIGLCNKVIPRPNMLC